MNWVEGAQAKLRQSLIRLATGALCLDRNRLVAVINHAAKMAALRGRTDPERSGKCVMVLGAKGLIIDIMGSIILRLLLERLSICGVRLQLLSPARVPESRNNKGSMSPSS